MKKWIALLLLLSLLLSGCVLGRERFQEPVTFYYPRAHKTAEQLDNFFTEGAIGEETREAVGHRQDLTYLLTMYLTGPLKEGLTSPYPVTTQLNQVQQDGNNLTVILTVKSHRTTSLDLTLGSACLAKTCMALTQLDTVQIQILELDGDPLFSSSFNEHNLLLEDGFPAPADSTDETQ